MSYDHFSPQESVRGRCGHKDRVKDDERRFGVEDVQGGLDPVLLVPPLQVHNDPDLDTCPPEGELVTCVIITCHKERKYHTNNNKEIYIHH